MVKFWSELENVFSFLFGEFGLTDYTLARYNNRLKMSQIVEDFKQKFGGIINELNEYIDNTDKESIDFSYITGKLAPIDEIMNELPFEHSYNDRAEIMMYWESENAKVIKKYSDKIKNL